jgi:hypothetical protein
MTIYLYKKTHNQTGLMYLGKTKSADPHSYRGSGTYWTAHIRAHGYDVTTEILRECASNEEVKEWGVYYSKLWNVVGACDEFGKKTWANLKEETGDGGNPGPDACRRIAENQKGRIPWNKGIQVWSEKERKEIGRRNKLRGPQSSDTVAKRVAKNTGKRRTLIQRQNSSMAQKGKILTEEHKAALSGKRPNVVAHNRDSTLYNFVHAAGVEEYCSRYDLCKKYSLAGPNVTALIQGNRHSHKGWSIKKVK